MNGQLRKVGRQGQLPRQKIQTPRMEIFKELADHSSRLMGMLQLDLDLNLAYVSHGVGMLSAMVGHNAQCDIKLEAWNLEELLTRIAGHVVGWLGTTGLKDPFTIIHVERERQHQLFSAGKLLFNCSVPGVEPKRKLRALIEELGEVAEAVDLLEHEPASKEKKLHLQTELVHLAGVAVAWLEAIKLVKIPNRCIKDECVYPGHCNCEGCIMERRES